MKCPECQNERERSVVRGGYGTTTCMGYETFWDEDGAWHSHDPNFTTASYRCSRGHDWSASTLSGCPSCDWAERHARACEERLARITQARDAQGMSAGTAETAQQAQGEARQPGPKDAPTLPSHSPRGTPAATAAADTSTPGLAADSPERGEGE